MKELTRDEEIICTASALDVGTLGKEGRKAVLSDLWDTAFAAGRAVGDHRDDMEQIVRARAWLNPEDASSYARGVVDGIEEERARWRAVVALLPAGARVLLAPFAESLWEANPFTGAQGTGSPHGQWKR